ncbi:MAG: 4Fe-4S dicluster domain-containing protein [Candidatus Diapherotrites archaeon]|nr:4Fe-4S dicluster domain-containing protein [Candidatus Diapherotrites archaeon]
MFLLKKQNLRNFIDALSQNEAKLKVIVPIQKDDGTIYYDEYEKNKDKEIIIEGRTDFSPKKYFLPEIEEIANFEKSENEVIIKEVLNNEKRIIFGIRPCDLNALLFLDEVLIKYMYPDKNYEARRKNTILIAIDCLEACNKSCFCSYLGTNIAKGYDICLTKIKEGFLVREGSNIGKNLLEKDGIRKILEKTDKEPKQISFECKNKINVEKIEELLEKNFESKVWQEEAERCLNCTSCTQVCPSCYCFYVKDELGFDDKKSRRLKCLDSCFLDRFSRISRDFVFRKSNKAKLRQFVCHNFYYSLVRNKMIKCVGCGRCIDVCPVKINIVEIIKKIRGYDGK